jgi:hypothetical protein
VRRAAVVFGIVAILASSCGQDPYPPRLAVTLDHRVAAIRGLAEAGQPGRALAATRDLIELVTARMRSGRLDQGKAMDILAAADVVVQRLALLPRPSPAESPSPPPVEEDRGDHGEGKGKGKDKGRDRGEDGNKGGND